MAEVEHVQRFVIEVPVFGNPEVEAERLKLRVARALYHGVKHDVRVAPAEKVANSWQPSGTGRGS